MQAPTDNLYEFSAVAGLLCFIFFYFDFNKRADEFSSNLDGWIMQQVELQTQLDMHSDAVERFSKKVDRVDSKKLSSKQIEAFVTQFEVINNRFQELKVVRAKINQSVIFARESYGKLKALGGSLCFHAVCVCYRILCGFVLLVSQDSKIR